MLMLASVAAAVPALGDEDPVPGCVVHTVAERPYEVLAECHWRVPHDRITEVLRNQTEIASVMSLVSESRALADGRFLQVHTVGWGIADRQITLQFQSSALADGGFRLDFAAAETQEQLGPDRVQVAADEGSWQVRPHGAGGTHLQYRVRYEAGGNLKPWMAMRFQASGVAKALDEILAAAQPGEKPESEG